MGNSFTGIMSEAVDGDELFLAALSSVCLQGELLAAQPISRADCVSTFFGEATFDALMVLARSVR